MLVKIEVVMVILCFVCSVFGSDIGGAGGGRTERGGKEEGKEA